MKKSLPFYILLLILNVTAVSAQEFKGQWKGEFIDKSHASASWGGDKCEYVLELETSGSTVTGFSYTYFNEGGKKYYIICKVEGFINKKTKYVEVRETERTKTNLPSTMNNCFQTHKLTYAKQGDSEVLTGSWVPAPNQNDCGFGFTTLSRRTLRNTLAGSTASYSRNAAPLKKPTITKSSPAVVKKAIVKRPQVAAATTDKKELAKSPADIPQIHDIAPAAREKKITVSTPDYKKRNINVLKRIEVASPTIKVDLYDNGEIDGDSVSLYYNGQLIASRKRLTDKAMSFTLNVDKDVEISELVMYAENLGSIPPNTALMVVTDGIKRYEVRITSDLQKSGVIQFVHE